MELYHKFAMIQVEIFQVCLGIVGECRLENGKQSRGTPCFFMCYIHLNI